MIDSQTSLLRGSTETTRHSPEIGRRSSKDMLRPSNEPSQRSQGRDANTVRSTATLRRPSLDMLRDQDNPELMLSLTENQSEDAKDGTRTTPLVDARFGSVRSILRDPNTPGTGQNVRFFSRDAYKVISPDNSMDQEFHSALSKNQEQTSEAPVLERKSAESGSPSSVLTRASQGKTSRPSVAEIFSPLSNDATSPGLQDQSQSGPTNFMSPIPAPAKPPGLGFNVEEPLLNSSIDLDASHTDDEHEGDFAGPNKFTSTPHREKGKGKAKEPLDEEKENIPIPVDESIFHADEKPRFPSVIHDRSQSFSFGQTVFHSMPNTSASAETSPVFLSAFLKPSLLDKDTNWPGLASSPRSRGRAMSDTVFQSIMRSPPKNPEADINDDSSQDLVVYSGGTGTSEPDPFRANATTYYTPQTMIPTTPPQGAPKHARKTSKEESIIFSLQTQLAFQSELCQQYEVDLRARDEMVRILEKKLADMEKDEVKRRNGLRTWKKKVQELEKTCRYLEEEVEGSRHESMERSVMDEASGEALRMLHRQIAVLEQEKNEWGRKEENFREEVETLENIVKDRSEDVMNLKETLWGRDESERELKEGIREAKEQMEIMGNVSVGLIDEDELKKLVVEQQQKSEEERERHRLAESGWQEERAEFLAQLQHLETEKAAGEEQLMDVKQQLQTSNDDHKVLKMELEAQWTHTEKTTARIEGLEARIIEVERERDAIKHDLEEKTTNMEVEWTESENKRVELESEVQQVLTYKDELEKERDRLEDELKQQRNHSESLTIALQEHEDRATSLDQDRQFAVDNASRLEEKLRQRDQELEEYSQRIAERETETERLQEEIGNLRRESSHVLDEQSRAVQEVSLREGEARSQMEALIRQKAGTDVEINTLKDKVTALKDEVERLRRQVHELQQESADKEVNIVQLTKQRAKDKEDLQGINIALDSKQQELELLKRKMGVRGTAGSTPAQSGRLSRQRETSVFSTPNVTRPSSRPSSAMSDASATTKGRRQSTESLSTSAKISALGKSMRINNAAGSAPSTTSKPSARVIEGSMGPPPVKLRASAAGTPTPTGRASSYSRFPITKPATTPLGTSVPQQRISSVEHAQTKKKPSRQGIASPALSVSEQDEKENISIDSKRRSLLPTPA
ncbi:hypothetical protein L208DRAFT_1405732 [Tricholoma matsutake]|nr:hypothetical protein L208DRAFT_1405732 [Tricholoma matsutake 945]